MLNEIENNLVIEAIPFKSFKEKIRTVKLMLKVGRVEIDNESNVILIIRKGD